MPVIDSRPCRVKWLLTAAGLILLAALVSPEAAVAYGKQTRASFQRSIIDYRKNLSRRFKKITRRSTRLIIVHTTESNLKSGLRTVSQGKRLHNGRRTHGGHAHYVIARNGKTYRILDKHLRADHAGRSMWNGRTDLSDTSIGIELVGYHYAPITAAQYRSVGILIEILQRFYGLPDRSVLTHSQIAYGKPNRWFRKNHRGRKRCAKNFDRHRAGLTAAWSYDPDVRAKRLLPDRRLAALFYGPGIKRPPAGKATAIASASTGNVISATNSAWAIAGEDYDSATTIYKLPDGRIIAGNRIEKAIGWSRLPSRTVVLLNQENQRALARQKGPVKTIANGLNAWSLAGSDYNHATTIYFLPDGRVVNGRMISDWDDLPERTRLVVGYSGPFKLRKGHAPTFIAGRKSDDPATLYLLPSRRIITGNRIGKFKRLPEGTLVFVPLS